MIKKISIRSPHSIKAITESDDQFKIIIPSNILNPPNRPFKKRYSHTSKGSLVSVNEVPRNLKYCNAIDLIMVNPQERTHEDVHNLLKLTAPMAYFQEMNRKSINQSERVHERCCAVLRYEFFKKGDVVFNAEEKPNKFFIIFSGSVNILIPKTEINFKRDSSKRNAVKITKKLMERYTKNKKQRNLDEFDDSENEEEEDNESDISPTKLRSELVKYTDLLGGIALTDLNMNNLEDIFVEGTLKFTYYSNLKEGSCFGELGLLRGKTRSATVLCKEDCHFAVMMAEDYKTIVAVIERKKIYNKFEFFKNFLVKGIAYDNLAKLAYSFDKKKYGRTEYVFKEGDSGNEVFLIKKGDIQIHKILIEQSQKNKKLFSNNPNFDGKRIPLLETFNKKNQILITLLEGEFFGEDEIVNNNNPNENFGQRTYSAFVSSPKASVYVCPIQFFKKYIFERPNLLKKLQEKYYIKKNLWEKQLSNCLIQRKDIYHKEISSYRKEDLPHLTVFSDKRNEENKPTLNLLTPLNSNEQISIKKSVIDLKSKISEMTHQNVFKNELSNSIIKKQKGKFINIDSLQITTSNDEKNNSTSNIPLSSVKNKSSSFESHIKFINKKYDQLMKDNKNNISECFHFQSDKDNHLQSRMNVYLKGKFKRYFNKSQTDEKLDNYKNSHNIKKFNDSLMKSIKTIKEREKIDFNSFRINHLENSVRDQDSVDKLFIKKNKQLIYINRIDLFSESLEASMKNNK